jgi:type VI secretion system protein ImpE
MNAAELYKAGQLQQAIDAQVKEVKASPGDPNRRLFLFELLAFAGDLDRAKRQVEAIQYNEMERDVAVMAYRKILDAETARRRLFKEGLEPKFLAPPGEHVAMRLEAVKLLRENRPAEAAALLAQAAAATPAVKGLLNHKPFDSLRDCDDLFGPVLEIIAQGVYYWVPLEQVDSLAMNPPRFPRDLVWFPARLTVREGPSGEAFLPALYPGSHEHPREQIKLGRENDWLAADGGPVRGVGAKMFLAGDDAVTLLDWRELQMA